MENTVKQEVARGHVNEWMDMLESEINRAERIQEEVQDRLQRLLYTPEVAKGSSEVVKESDVPEPESTIAPLAHDIRRFTLRLRHVSDLHDKILTELEI